MKYELPDIELVNSESEPLKIVSSADSEDLAEATIDLFEILGVNPHNIVNSKDKNVSLVKTEPPVAGERNVISELPNEQLLIELDLIVKDFNDMASDIKKKSESVFNSLVARSLSRIAHGH